MFNNLKEAQIPNASFPWLHICASAKNYWMGCAGKKNAGTASTW